MLDLTPKVIEEDAQGEPADPYVIAQALTLIEAHDPVIVTEDVVDRLPLKMALASAAVEHGISWCGLADFATALEFGCRNRNDPDD